MTYIRSISVFQGRDNKMDPLELAISLFRENFKERNNRSPYWRRIYRHFARQALDTIRSRTGKPRKRWQPVLTTLGELHDGDLFVFHGNITPTRARGNGWYDGPGGPYYQDRSTVVYKISK